MNQYEKIAEIMKYVSLSLMALACIAASMPSCKKKEAHATETVPEISVARAVTDSVTIYKSIPGTIRANDKVDLVARVNGYLRSTNYQSGDIVEKGQLLFTIEDQTYRDAVSQAQASLASAQSAYEYASSHYEALQKAFKSDAVSAMEVKQAKSAMEQAAADIREARAQLQTAQTTLGYCRVYAPFRGRVSASGPGVGAYLNGAGAPVTLATIYNDAKVQAYFTIEDASFMRQFESVKQREHVNYDSIPLVFSETLPHSYKASLKYIAPEVDASTGTMQLRAVLDNPYGELREGMYVSVQFPMGVNPEAVLIKDASISTDQLGKYIYTVNDSNKVVYTHIETGALVHDSMRVVTSGLKAGTPYVTKALLKVRPGVKIKPSYTR